MPFTKIQRGFQGITNLQICPRFSRNHAGIIKLERKREKLLVFFLHISYFFNSSDYHYANTIITFITKYDIIYIIIRKGRYLPILLIYIQET